MIQKLGFALNILLSSSIAIMHAFRPAYALNAATEGKVTDAQPVLLHYTALLGVFHFYNAFLSIYAIKRTQVDPVSTVIARNQVSMWLMIAAANVAYPTLDTVNGYAVGFCLAMAMVSMFGAFSKDSCCAKSTKKKN
jgi:hypothetical protein